MSARTIPGRIPDPMVESVPVGTVSTSTMHQGTKTWRNDKHPFGLMLNATSEAAREHLIDELSESCIQHIIKIVNL